MVCSAYADYDWLELLARLGHSDKVLVIKKPFEPIEILQAASALSRKWQNARTLKSHVESLERVVNDRTKGLEAANRQLRHLAIARRPYRAAEPHAARGPHRPRRSPRPSGSRMSSPCW